MKTRHLLALSISLAAAPLLVGCDGHSTPLPTGTVSVHIARPSGERLTRAYDDIHSVTITVTGDEISPPVVHDLTYNSGDQSWSGSFSVPSGQDRTFNVAAKDINDKVLYTGSAISDVKAGATTAITIDLYEEGERGQIVLRVTIANAYYGIGKVPAAVGFYTAAGQDPSYHSVIPESQIADQFIVLSKRVSAVRTYECEHGNEFAVKYANQHGLPIALGVWLGPDTTANDAEVAAAVNIIKQGGNAKCLVVGSEAMLRGDLSEQQIVSYINTVRSQVNVPIACADTWSVWFNGGTRRDALAAAVDIVMIHCWPYWEGVPYDQALESVKSDYAKVTALYPDKKVVIGETGWPSDGNPQGSAIPSALSQRRFTKNFVEWAQSSGVEFYLFEFFDEPWKHNSEPNGVGDHWGYFGSDYQEKPEILKIWF